MDVLQVSPCAECDIASASEDEYVEAFILPECLDRLEKQPCGLCVNRVANLRAVDGDDDGSTFAFRLNLRHGSTLLAASHESIYNEKLGLLR
jgi:hypothetical protein